MSQWNAKDLVAQAEACRALLRRLPGVYAAGPRFDENGELSEIHVLASLARNPQAGGAGCAIRAICRLWHRSRPSHCQRGANCRKTRSRKKTARSLNPLRFLPLRPCRISGWPWRGLIRA